jgi:Fic-DOC domain mobile mystery protein B
MTPLSELNSNPDNTALSAEDAEQLIPDLSTRQDLDEYERQNILLAQDWAFSTRALKHNDPLDEIYIRELHRQMFKDTWKWAGKYRIRDVNRCCSSAEIITRIANLLSDGRYWLSHKTFALEEIAIRIHHRMVGEIHPFPNGNGRHARMLADILLTKHGGERFTWGRSNLVSSSTVKEAYLSALRQLDADSNNVAPLLNFARS